jgi:HK97 gp10 family phage protein
MAGTFNVQVKNLDKLTRSLEKYPKESEPILQRAIDASNAVLAKHTIKGNVPWRTGNLVQSFRFASARLRASWFPTASYAKFVHDGTSPHTIEVKSRRVLANTDTGEIFGRRVQHPGTKAQPFLETNLGKSRKEIEKTFAKALDLIVARTAK